MEEIKSDKEINQNSQEKVEQKSQRKFDKKSIFKNIMEWVYCFLIAIVLVIIIKTFIGIPTIIKESSMFPTLEQDERVWLNKIPAMIHKLPQRGEIITFGEPSKLYINKSESDLTNPVAEYNYQFSNIYEKFKYNILEIGKKSYIKRVIGLPGERITIKNDRVYINNELLEESYLKENVETKPLEGVFLDVIVPENCVYVMGDNRPNSADSRRFGCIPLEKIESVAVYRFWPFAKSGKI